MRAITKSAKIHSAAKKSQHGCGRWAPQPHLTPPCSDFACGGLRDIEQGRTNEQGGTNERTNRGATNEHTNIVC